MTYSASFNSSISSIIFIDWRNQRKRKKAVSIGFPATAGSPKKWNWFGLCCKENRWDQTLNCTERSCAIEDSLLEYGRKNLALFHVLIKDPYSVKYRRDEEIPVTSFIGNVGGLLGLYLGFSWISGAEIIFYVTKAIFSVLFKKREDNENVNTCKSVSTGNSIEFKEIGNL